MYSERFIQSFTTHVPALLALVHICTLNGSVSSVSSLVSDLVSKCTLYDSYIAPFQKDGTSIVLEFQNASMLDKLQVLKALGW